MKKLLHFLLIFLLPTLAKTQPSEWKPAGPGGGGALFSPSYNPANTDEIYLASDLGAMFHTKNLGKKWDVEPFTQLVATPASKVHFTENQLVRYTLRTNGFETEVVKTTDGGTTWKPLSGTSWSNDPWNLFVDPKNGQRLLVSSYSDLYFSKDGGTTFQYVYGASDLYIGGVFWEGQNIFVGCRTGLVVSTDGGTSFWEHNISDALPTDYGMLSFAGARAGNLTRLFCVARKNDSMWPGMQGSEFWGDQAVYRYDWGNPVGGWVKAETGIPAGDFPFFIATSPENVDIVWAAGATENPIFPAVWKSTNGGSAWQNVFKVVGNQNIATGWQCNGGDDNWWWGGNAMGFAVAPGNPNRAIISDFGFVHHTIDGGQLWVQAYVDPTFQNPPGDVNNQNQYYRSVGLEPTSLWDLTWSDAQNVWASFTDIGASRSKDGGKTWSFDYNGNDYNTTYRTVRHPANGTLYAATSSVHDLYQSTYLSDDRIDDGTGEVLFSTDKGANWQTLKNFQHPVVWLELDPKNANTLYASVVHSTEGGIYVTKNLQMGAAATWTKLPAPPRTQGHPFVVRVLDDGSLVCSYSGRRDAVGFTQSSGVFYSQNGGQTWLDRSDPNMLRWTKDIVIDPHDPAQNTWYACVFSHWGSFPNEVGGLFRSKNRGQTWTELGDFYRVESCTVHPTKPDELYLTTESEGLLRTQNLNAATPTFKLVDSYPFWHPLRVFYNPFNVKEIWVSSFGNGLRIGDESPVGTGEAEANFSVKIYPQPATDALFVELEKPVSGELQLALFDLAGRSVFEKTFSAGEKMRLPVDGVAAGVFALRISTGGQVIWRKVVVE